MKNKSAIPIWLTTVTPLSKAIALLMFVLLPFLGFILGLRVCQKGDFNIYDIKCSKCGAPNQLNTLPNPQFDNKVVKIKKADGTLEINLTIIGTIENLKVTDIEIPYRYKIVLDKPILDIDAIADARGENIPKKEYVLLSYGEETIYKLNDGVNKKVLITGTLEWGFAETRHLNVNSIKLL